MKPIQRGMTEANREVERGLLAGYMHSVRFHNTNVTYKGITAKEALSTTTTTEHLHKYVTEHPEEFFGEPVAEVIKNQDQIKEFYSVPPATY